MLSSYKYCVVIPHRNIPKLLRRCLTSIPKLPYVHVLVVDNSDADKKASLLIGNTEFGVGGLTVIEREPLGIGYIRNEAIRYLREQHFCGKLVFADADDYFTNEANTCFEQFINTDKDIIWFSIKGEDEQGRLTNNAEFVKRNLSIYKKKDDFGALRYNSGPVWGKFIDMDLIYKNNLSFQEIETCEDTLFSAKLGYYAKNPFVCMTSLYVYVQQEGSLVMTINANKAKTGYLAAYDTTCWLKERTEEGYFWTQYNVIWHWMNWCGLDLQAWTVFPKVLELCNKKDAWKGARKVITRRIKAILRIKR